MDSMDLTRLKALTNGLDDDQTSVRCVSRMVMSLPLGISLHITAREFLICAHDIMLQTVLTPTISSRFCIVANSPAISSRCPFSKNRPASLAPSASHSQINQICSVSQAVTNPRWAWARGRTGQLGTRMTFVAR
jgi:hypothetical protein